MTTKYPTLLKQLLSIFKESSMAMRMNYLKQEHTLVSKWLQTQLSTSSDALKEIVDSNGWLEISSPDARCIAVLRYVKKRLKYVSDKTQYRTTEYWASIAETLASNQGDCEDINSLIYCLCRVAGIPNDQLFFVAGTIRGGVGHAWVRYVSEQFPYGAYYLDASAWYDGSYIPKRQIYSDYQKRKGISGSGGKYESIWWIANEEKSYKWV